MSQQLHRQMNALKVIYTGYLDKTRGLTFEQFNHKPAPDQWSVAQVMHHLWSSSDFTQSFMERRIAEQKVVRPTGIKTAFRNILLHLVLASPLKFKAPKAVLPISEKLTYAELENAFKNNMANFDRLLENFPEELEGKEIFKHPRIGYISIEQTLAFLKAHSLHHMRQLDNLLSKV